MLLSCQIDCELGRSPAQRETSAAVSIVVYDRLSADLLAFHAETLLAIWAQTHHSSDFP
jgi:hypothetical protein